MKIDFFLCLILGESGRGGGTNLRVGARSERDPIHMTDTPPGPAGRWLIGRLATLTVGVESANPRNCKVDR